jgi:glyoxylase-like metal-dependent hydrolase (beta-lactamase superfamily II)
VEWDLDVYTNQDFFNSRSYLIKLKDKKCFLIDPVISSNGCSLYKDLCMLDACYEIYVFLTHEHFDHFYGINQLLEKKNVHLMIFDDLLKAIGDPKQNLSFYYNCPYLVRANNCFYYEFVDNIFKINKLGVTIYLTPGHSRYSNCILFDKYLFGGDTIIEESYVTTKLPGGSRDKFNSSVNNLMRLFKNENIIVYPGHGESFNFKEWCIKYDQK